MYPKVRNKIIILVNSIAIYRKSNIEEQQKQEALKIINSVSPVLFKHIVMFMQEKHIQKYNFEYTNDPSGYYKRFVNYSYDLDIQTEAIERFTNVCIKNPQLLIPGYTTKMYLQK